MSEIEYLDKKCEALEAERDRLQAKNARLRSALKDVKQKLIMNLSANAVECSFCRTIADSVAELQHQTWCPVTIIENALEAGDDS